MPRWSLSSGSPKARPVGGARPLTMKRRARRSARPPRYSLRATAGEPTELFVLRREDFLSHLEREPRVAIKIIQLLCQRIRWQSERMEESMLQPLPVRLARRLVALASDYGSEVHISQEQLGVFVGAARESVNRQPQAWRKDGILDLQRGRILLQNMTKLTAVARNE